MTRTILEHKLTSQLRTNCTPLPRSSIVQLTAAWPSHFADTNQLPTKPSVQAMRIPQTSKVVSVVRCFGAWCQRRCHSTTAACQHDCVAFFYLHGRDLLKNACLPLIGRQESASPGAACLALPGCCFDLKTALLGLFAARLPLHLPACRGLPDLCQDLRQR